MIFLQKATAQYLIVKTVLLYLLKVYPSLWTSTRNQGTLFRSLAPLLGKIARNQPKKMIKLQLHLLLLVIFLLCIPGITSYNLGYCSESSLWALVLWNSAKTYLCISLSDPSVYTGSEHWSTIILILLDSETYKKTWLLFAYLCWSFT